MSESLVLHADNHGRPNLIYAVDHFYKSDVRQLILGDVFDGPDTKGALQAINDVGAHLLLGNHEWCFLASILEEDLSRRLQFASAIWPRLHDRVLQSYGIYPSTPSPDNIRRLYNKMPDAHKSLLAEARLFHETDQYVAIHAGITAHDWQAQRSVLLDRDVKRRINSQYVVEEDYIPSQLYEAPKLADRNTTVADLGKILINGHFHRPFTTFEDRWSDQGDRLYLATQKTDTFVLVWESWTKRLRRVHTKH